MEIKVGFCIAYDWEFLRISLPIIYPYADKICLSMDKDLISWSGHPFHINREELQLLVEQVDIHHKIMFYEDNFHIDQDPMVNEVLQRNRMAEKLGKDSGWHLQLDVDEYPIDMKGLVAFLEKSQKRFKKPINICLPWITLFKQLDSGFLIIHPVVEWMQIVTNHPSYEYGRRNGYFNYKLNSPILHQSWARSNEEIKDKVKNWGHSKDFDGLKFYQFWKDINIENYKLALKFHPEQPDVWEKLIFIKADNVKELLGKEIDLHKVVKFSNFKLAVINNRFVSKLKSIFQ